VLDAFGRPQSVLVLGGSSEIGGAVLRRWSAGPLRRVVLAGRNGLRLQAAAARLAQPGLTVQTVPFDGTDTDSHDQALRPVFTHGDIDVVLLAFGVLGDQTAAENDPALAVTVARTNYVGAVSAGLIVASHLRRQGHGHLVVLSSVAAERARRANFVYGSSKAGLDAFAQGLGDALHGSGAHVLIVRPGFVRTRMTAGRPAAPFAVDADTVAAAITRGVTHRSHIIWVPPILRPVMAVTRYLPRPVFRRLSR
jgi:decaprenylphospho-beta-D-erythro-pentofuranosid-2-ulose 2-reductase